MGTDKCLYIVLITMVTVTCMVDTKSIGNGSKVIEKPINDNRTTSDLNSLHAILLQLSRQYQNTLVNSTLLPFLNNCSFVYNITSSSTISQSSAIKQSKENLLCVMYFDMVYNLGKSGFTDYQIEANVIDTLKVYDNATLISNFCNLFGGEIPTEEDKRPFETAIMSKAVSSKVLNDLSACNLLCLQWDDIQYQTRIMPVCKLISGGYRSWKLHLIDHHTTPNTSVGSKPNVTETVGTAVAAQPSGGSVQVPEIGNSDQKIVGEELQLLAKNTNDTQLKAPKSAAAPPPPLPEVPVQQAPNLPVAEVQEITPEQPITNVGNQNAIVNASISKAPTVVNASAELASLTNDKTSTKDTNSLPKVDVALNEETENKILEPDQPERDEDDYAENEKTEKETNSADGIAKLINSDADDDETFNDDESLQKPDDNTQAQKEIQVNSGNHNMRNDKAELAEKQIIVNNHIAEFQNDPFSEDKNSSFFSYFLFMLLVSATLYVVYHNKTKVMALLVEGRRSRNGSRDGRRKHRAAYRKLDSNLEEAIQSSGKVSSSQIIY